MTTIIGALAPSDIQAMLTAGLTLPPKLQFATDGDIPPAPDQLHVITGPYGGPGMILEGAFDVLAFQLLSRGLQGGGVAGKAAAADSARVLAWQADRFLLEQHTPCMVGTQRVKLITRAGGPPTMFRREPSGRVTFTCNYLFDTARY